MAEKNFLIFDFGASNGRVSVANYDGKKFKFDIIHRFENIPVFAAETLYWDFLRLFFELKSGLTIAFKKYKNIASMGLDTWGVDFGLIDKNGKLISNPVHYRDTKRNSVCDELFSIIPQEELFNLTGNPAISYYSIFNLYSLKIQNATEYLTAYKFLMMPDLFNYFLTGVMVNEYTDAHTTTMCSPFEMRWENKILDKLNFPRDIFCEIVQPGTKIGEIKKSICDELSINSIPVVAPATHDTPSAIAGIPVVDKSKNIVFISIGTWGIIIIEMDKPNISKQVYESGFANEAGVDGKMLLFKNFIGMWLIQQSRDRWVKDSGKEITWDDIMNLAMGTSSIESFIDIDASIFVLAQTDMPKTIKDFCARTGQKIPDSIGAVARVIYESMALKVKHNLIALDGIIGSKLDFIHMVGGGTKDKLLCQWIADATGLHVYAGPSETTSIGNLLMQLKAAGEIKNLEEGRQISLNSSKVENYIPQDTQDWDEKYQAYLKIL